MYEVHRTVEVLQDQVLMLYLATFSYFLPSTPQLSEGKADGLPSGNHCSVIIFWPGCSNLEQVRCNIGTLQARRYCSCISRVISPYRQEPTYRSGISRNCPRSRRYRRPAACHLGESNARSSQDRSTWLHMVNTVASANLQYTDQSQTQSFRR
jgi:hypothetical protein